jgi:hypothetical protein
MDQYCVIQNFKSALAARAFLCQDYHKCFLIILSISQLHGRKGLQPVFTFCRFEGFTI